MPKLTEAILPQRYELIAPQIVAILNDELPNQATLTGADVLNATVLLERNTPANQDEYPLVTVRLGNTNPDNKSYDGDYLCTNTFIIDGYVRSSNTDTNGADELSMLGVQRLMGVIREVLLAPYYANLDFEAKSGIVRSVKNLGITYFNSGDTEQSFGVSSGQMVLEVVTNESSEQIKLETIKDYVTNVTEAVSGKEVEWKGVSSNLGFNYLLNFALN